MGRDLKGVRLMYPNVCKVYMTSVHVFVGHTKYKDDNTEVYQIDYNEMWKCELVREVQE